MPLPAIIAAGAAVAGAGITAWQNRRNRIQNQQNYQQSYQQNERQHQAGYDLQRDKFNYQQKANLRAREWQQADKKQQREWQQADKKQVREWQLQDKATLHGREDTEIQRRRADMEAAGMHPTLAVGGGAASSPVAAGAGGQPPGGAGEMGTSVGPGGVSSSGQSTSSPKEMAIMEQAKFGAMMGQMATEMDFKQAQTEQVRQDTANDAKLLGMEMEQRLADISLTHASISDIKNRWQNDRERTIAEISKWAAIVRDMEEGGVYRDRLTAAQSDLANVQSNLLRFELDRYRSLGMNASELRSAVGQVAGALDLLPSLPGRLHETGQEIFEQLPESVQEALSAAAGGVQNAWRWVGDRTWGRNRSRDE